MKKVLLLISVFFLGLGSMQAQVAYQKSKFFDNWYAAVEGGALTQIKLDPMFPINGWAGVKIGKDFNPMFGANLEGMVGLGDNGLAHSYTIAKILNFGLNGTVNLTNIFRKYNPNNRFDLIAEAGVGYYMVFGDPGLISIDNMGDDTELTSKQSLLFAWNLGEARAWQIFAGPTFFWNLTTGPGDAVQFKKRAGQMGIFAGVKYKFMTSNGTHNFKVFDLGEMNDEINNLRAQLDAKPQVEEVVKEVVKEVPVVKEVDVDKMVFVTFAQSKYYLTAQAKQTLDAVPAGTHVQVIGTASPEGPKQFNQTLSQNRANVVAKYLTDRGVIVDKATGKGVEGVTSNRLAIVYVK